MDNTTAQALFEAAKGSYSSVVEGLAQLKWEDVPELVRLYIENTPGLNAASVILILLIACPLLAATPALAASGFGALGPIASSAAAAFQAAFGTNVVFSTLQSAAMGGYGQAIVATGIKGASVAGLAVTEWFKHRNGTG